VRFIEAFVDGLGMSLPATSNEMPRFDASQDTRSAIEAYFQRKTTGGHTPAVCKVVSRPDSSAAQATGHFKPLGVGFSGRRAAAFLALSGYVSNPGFLLFLACLQGPLVQMDPLGSAPHSGYPARCDLSDLWSRSAVQPGGKRVRRGVANFRDMQLIEQFSWAGRNYRIYERRA
jgi:hypothetical protein